jgi:aspartyl-tRNA(Asn)/glutamyl-tRNA(Gln) amidotransferase subunit A
VLSDDVLYLPVRALAGRIKSGKLSATELTEAYLARSEGLGPRLNAYATLTSERALREAKAADREIAAGRYRGPLHGIPYAAKDLLAVKGYPTTWGARPFAKQSFDRDATVVVRLREAGAVLLGKAAMIGLAGGFGYRYAAASLTGPSHNPWNEKHWAGGSSSGSGVIASAALAAFAIGTETWGSVVCPASYCGVTGLRPTYGRVSRSGGMVLSGSMDKVGVLARTADDCAAVLAAISGPDPNDPSSLPDGKFADAGPPADRPVRVGWCVNAWKKLDPGIAAVTAKARDAFADGGGRVVEVSLPEGPWDEAANTVIAVEGAGSFEKLLDSGRAAQLDDPLQRVGGYVAQQIPAADYLRAQRIRAALQKKADALFERCDVLAAASMPLASTPITANMEDPQYDYADPLGAIGNLCGLPAVSVPCGFTKDKLPLGVQFVGRALDDGKVLEAARTFQRLTEWHTRRPPIA